MGTILPHYPHSIPRWRVAYLALQCKLGLRPQRRTQLGTLGHSHSVADWSDLPGYGKTLLARRGVKFCCAEMKFRGLLVVRYMINTAGHPLHHS